MVERSQAIWMVHVTLGIALAIHLLPVPFEWRMYHPPLVELTLCYWVLALPHRVGIISSASVGLALDLVEGSPAGAQSLGLVLSSLMVLLNYQRIRQFDLLQQTVTVSMLVALSLTVERWCQGLVGLPLTGAEFLLPVVSVPVLWPIVRTVLREIRREWRVA